MDPKDFLILADALAADTMEAAWRTSISRMYYAVFHVARDLLRDLGFSVPRADRAHSHVYLRLANCGNPPVQGAANDRNTSRQLRNEADYDVGNPFAQIHALGFLPVAKRIVPLLASAKVEPIRSQILGVMKTYERDVLQDVTWRP